MSPRLLLLLFFSLLLAPALPVSDRLAGASRLVSSTRLEGRARAAVLAKAADAPVSGGEIICTQFLKAGFRSMFVIQDDPLQSAEDENGLCDLCVKVVRFGVMNVNDARHASNFKQIMRDRACRFEEPERTQDCKLLTETILASQSDWFGSDAAKLSSLESNSSLSIMVNSHQKSEVFCKNIRCCRRLRPNPSSSLSGLVGTNVTVTNLTGVTSNSAWANLTLEQQRLVVAEDRASLTHDKDLLDAMKDNLDRYQHQLNKLRSSLVTKEQTLSEREKLILTGVLRERMIAKAKAMEELAAAEAQRLAIQQELDDKRAAEDEKLAKEGKPRPGAPLESPAERDARIARMKARKKRKLLEQAYAQEQKKMAALVVQAAQASSNSPSPSPSTGISFRSLSHRASPPPPDYDDDDDDEHSDDDEDADEGDTEP